MEAPLTFAISVLHRILFFGRGFGRMVVHLCIRLYPIVHSGVCLSRKYEGEGVYCRGLCASGSWEVGVRREGVGKFPEVSGQ